MAKKHHKKKQLPVVLVGELVTPERRRQLGGVVTEMVDEDGSSRRKMKRHKARYDCMIEFYCDEGTFSDRQTKAGLKYREIYLSGIHGQSGKYLCNPFTIDCGRADPENKIIGHMHNLRLLVEANELLTEEERGIVRDVCAYDRVASAYDLKRILLRALDVLADYWKYEND
ncbi:MAG: hypothetical protein WCD70_03870 [Alphaproteobacteria bacterium]